MEGGSIECCASKSDIHQTCGSAAQASCLWAAQVIANPRARSLRARDGMLLEAVITAGLAHRNLATTHGHVWVSRRVGGRRGEDTLSGALSDTLSDTLSDDGPQSGLLLELTSPGRWRADVMTWAASPDMGQGWGSGEGLGSGRGAHERRAAASGPVPGREHSPMALELRALLEAEMLEACNGSRLPEAAGCRAPREQGSLLGKPRQAGRACSSSEVCCAGARVRSEEVWLIMDLCDRGCLQARRSQACQVAQQLFTRSGHS